MFESNFVDYVGGLLTLSFDTHATYNQWLYPNDFFCILLSKLDCIISGRFTGCDFTARQRKIMVWSSVQREICLHIDKKILYFSFNFSCFEHFVIFIFFFFCMSLFGSFRFWAPTRFSEVNRPRYDPELA